MIPENTSPFSFLDNILNLLIIEDDPFSLDLIQEILISVPLYVLHTAKSSSEALALLRSGTRFHACILDLGMTDIENDEFYILRQYANHCSIIVLTGSNSPNKGATCIQLGARAVMEKGVNFNSSHFFEIVNRNVLLNIVNHRYSETGADTLNFATKVLFEKNPRTVTQWSDYMRITDRQLRNLWHSGSGFGAKYILFIYNLLSAAFGYYNTMLFGSLDERKMLQSHFDQKLSAYFQSNRDVMTFLLS